MGGERNLESPASKSNSNSSRESCSKKQKPAPNLISPEESREFNYNARATRKRRSDRRVLEEKNSVTFDDAFNALDDLKSFSESLLGDLEVRRENMLHYMKEQLRKLRKKKLEKRKTYANLSLKGKSSSNEKTSKNQTLKLSNGKEDILESYVGSNVAFDHPSDPNKSSVYLLSRPFVENLKPSHSAENHVKPSTGMKLNIAKHHEHFPDMKQEKRKIGFSGLISRRNSVSLVQRSNSIAPTDQAVETSFSTSRNSTAFESQNPGKKRRFEFN